MTLTAQYLSCIDSVSPANKGSGAADRNEIQTIKRDRALNDWR